MSTNARVSSSNLSKQRRAAHRACTGVNTGCSKVVTGSLIAVTLWEYPSGTGGASSCGPKGASVRVVEDGIILGCYDLLGCYLHFETQCLLLQDHFQQDRCTKLKFLFINVSLNLMIKAATA